MLFRLIGDADLGSQGVGVESFGTGHGHDGRLERCQSGRSELLICDLRMKLSIFTPLNECAQPLVGRV